MLLGDLMTITFWNKIKKKIAIDIEPNDKVKLEYNLLIHVWYWCMIG